MTELGNCEVINMTLVKRKVGGLGFLLGKHRNSFVVTNVTTGSSAQEDGQLQLYDEVKGIDNKHFNDIQSLINYISEIDFGKGVELTIKRHKSGENGKKQMNGIRKEARKTAPAQPDINKFNGIATHCQQELGVIEKNVKNCNKEKREQMHDIMHDISQEEHIGLKKPMCPMKTVCPMKPVVLNNIADKKQATDTLHQQAAKTYCTADRCTGSVMYPYGGESDLKQAPGEMRPKDEVKKDGKSFMKQYFASMGSENSENHLNRMSEVLSEIDAKGIYKMTEDELMFGARLAWRNAARCIGRIQWKKLKLFDFRHVTTAKEMFECLLTHIKYATNKGKLRSTISIFPPRTARRKDFRIWNGQLIRYAGYKQEDGTVIGDPAGVELTEMAQQLGWVGKGTRFDVLPLILQANGELPEYFEIPEEDVMEVNITHPKYREFEELDLKWYVLPAVANMSFDCGGLEFTAAPFNGWYMATEIGARNFADNDRYGMLKATAECIGLDTSNNVTLWKDIAVLELTQAVLHSFNEAGVTIVDHHTASESFIKHLKDEQQLRGGCPADWVWIVPPLSGSTTKVFHQEMLNYKLKPSYEYQVDPWKYFPLTKDSSERKKKLTFKDVARAVKVSNILYGDILAKRKKVTILYATETGKSEEYATMLNELFLHAFDSKKLCMEDYNFAEIENEECLFIVASTFGNGEAPDNGKEFKKKLKKMVFPNGRSKQETALNTVERLRNTRYSVFALGSRAYPTFCAFGKLLNKYLKSLGGKEISPLVEGDELDGQEESFKIWARTCFKTACDMFCITDVKISPSSMAIWKSATDWKKGMFKIEKADGKNNHAGLTKTLSKLHRRKIETAKVIDVQNLQAEESERVTNLIRLDASTSHNLNYQPGDHLCVYPSNDKHLVERLLKHVNCLAEADVRLCIKKKEDDSRWCTISSLPMPTSLREIFTNFLDITTPPAAKLLLLLADACENVNEKEMLCTLAKNTEVYEDWRYMKYPNILEVLKEFPSIKVDLTMLINQLPILKPRFYSISSSPKKYPNEIHLTVALVSYMVDENTQHFGVCSSWLNSLRKDDIVPCLVRSAPKFRLPKDDSAPVIMVGPGTGIAPFRSFWQQRDVEDKTSNMYLFFGCRNSKLDHIYEKEKLELVQKGVFRKVYNAFSREENTPKTYVQDLIRKHADEVINLILQHDGHLFVCGDLTMATAVERTILQLVKEYSAFTEKEAKRYVGTMKTEGRYHEDIFGATLQRK
ncbi:nitric oxide synthase, inducible-like isoform X2 [Hydractinia symbiolongicarpus]|nr:nitric oxide synthase, inducible-like isoform X2 [Hydractinia symbiolongicarpus]XP_057298421.1 nitric oxide synthase, inducible-like isoform X2 [Hydractinia symbiolongicarpus]